MLLLLTMTQFINLLFYTQLFPPNWRYICHHIYFQTLTKFTRTRHFSHRNVVFLRVIQFRLIKPSETYLNHVAPSVPLPLQFFHTTNTFQLKWTSCCLLFFLFFSMHCRYSFMYSFIFFSHPQTSTDINFPVLFPILFYVFLSSSNIHWYQFSCIISHIFLIFCFLLELNFSVNFLRSLFQLLSHEIIIDLEPLCVALLWHPYYTV